MKPIESVRMASQLLGFLVAALLFLTASAANATVFYYLDPAAPAGGNGSQASPWNDITTSNGNWTTINNAIASDDVIVYCSARQTGSDTNSIWNRGIDVFNRTAAVTHRLTFDGRSKWHSGATWSDYNGNSRCKMQGFNAENPPASAKINNITIDGFIIFQSATGDSAGWGSIVSICGDNWIVQNNDISGYAAPQHSTGVLTVPTADATHGGASGPCPASTNIQILNNKVHGTSAMNVYIGGGGCTQFGTTDASNFNVANGVCQGAPSHSNILIEGNTIYDCDTTGAGDTACLGMKAALSNVTIRLNDISNSAGGPVQSCFDMAGTTTPGSGGGLTRVNQNIVIERNYFHDCPNDAANGYSGLEIENTWGTPNGIVIRNNIVANITAGTAAASGIRIEDVQQDGAQVYNNTIYSGNDIALYLPRYGVYNGTVTYENNAVLNPNHPDTSLAGSVVADHNAYDGTWGGTCTSCVPGLTAAAFNNVGARDFTLPATSVLIGKGVTISSFSNDYLNNPRPAGSWDIGAYQFRPATRSPSPPRNLRLN